MNWTLQKVSEQLVQLFSKMSSYHSILKIGLEENVGDHLVHSPNHKLYTNTNVVPKYMVTIKAK